MFWNLFDSKHTKELKKLRNEDIIIIDCLRGFTVTVGNKEYSYYPINCTVINNDLKRKILYVKFITVNKDEHKYNLTYNCKYLKNYLLYNVIEKRKQKSKDELQKELKNAIDNDNFELAEIINNKIKSACK